MGQKLHETGDMEHDAHVKRALFIAESVKLREALSFASPVEILATMKVYCCSYYGSMLWDLSGDGVRKVFNAWITAVKLSWAVPRGTRTYLVQQVLSAGLTSARVDIMTRYVGFYRSIIEEQKQQGRKKLSNPEECLKKTLQSKLEKNLLYNEEETNHFPPQMDGRKKSRFQLEVSKKSA